MVRMVSLALNQKATCSIRVGESKLISWDFSKVGARKNFDIFIAQKQYKEIPISSNLKLSTIHDLKPLNTFHLIQSVFNDSHLHVRSGTLSYKVRGFKVGKTT